MLRAAVRITLSARHVDPMGWLTSEGLRELRHQLEDVPTRSSITIDLGALHKLDEPLVVLLSTVPAASITIESSDWRLAHRMTLRLMGVER